MTLTTEHKEYKNSGQHWVKFEDGYHSGWLKEAEFSIRFMDGELEIAHAYGVTAHNVMLAILRQASDRYLKLLRDGIDCELELRKGRTK